VSAKGTDSPALVPVATVSHCCKSAKVGLRTDPKLDELRDEPEFQELLKLAGMDVWPMPARVS